MKILYDYQAMMMQRFGGISNYHHELMTQLRKMGHQADTWCVGSQNYYFEKELKRGNSVASLMKADNWNQINKMVTSIILLLGEYDIFHPTYHDAYCLNLPIHKTKLVITVHDMIHELMPGYFSKDNHVAEGKKKLIEHADSIIAISNNTKMDILKYNPTVDAKKIHVIYHGIKKKIKTKKFDAPKRYILFVGARSGYKNFQRFFKAITPILKEDPDLFLLCTGGTDWNVSEKNLIHREHLQQKICRVDLSDEEMNYAYKHALCFVFPSEYEGFGLPVLEAFKNNCPCVLSGTSSLPEVGGDAALYFDPKDETDIRDKIYHVIGNAELRNNLIQREREQEKKFSVERMIHETEQVYAGVVREQRG